MNNRIKELAERCYETGPIGKDGWPEYSKFNEEKFAELIVRECSNMAESFQRHQYDFTGDLELHEFMKNHFGVEE